MLSAEESVNGTKLCNGRQVRRVLLKRRLDRFDAMQGSAPSLRLVSPANGAGTIGRGAWMVGLSRSRCLLMTSLVSSYSLICNTPPLLILSVLSAHCSVFLLSERPFRALLEVVHGIGLGVLSSRCSRAILSSCFHYAYFYSCSLCCSRAGELL